MLWQIRGPRALNQLLQNASLFLGILGSKQLAQEGMHTCAPSANKSGKKKKKKTKRSFFPAPLRQHHTSPRTPSTQFIFLPIKVSPPAWLWETQFMLRALGILFLAGTEKGSQRGGGSGSRTSRSLVSRRQRRAGTGSPRADRKSAAPPRRPPRATAGPARAGDGATAMGGLGGLQQCWGRGREGGCSGAGAPGQRVALAGAMGTSRASWDNGPMGLPCHGTGTLTPRHGAAFCQPGTACHSYKIGRLKW